MRICFFDYRCNIRYLNKNFKCRKDILEINNLYNIAYMIYYFISLYL